MTEPVGDVNTVMQILSAHSDKNFVQRIMSPKDYPRLYDNPGGEAGEASTHSMAAEVDENGDWYVFPTVIQRPVDGKLQRLPLRSAQGYARQLGQRIGFGKNKDAALWFASDDGYKQVWSLK